ncbi:MAG: hypothetical protein OEL89_04750 [Candidatus Peregrinibacteria bacterium]|nr:hypothetical protein [Candidatus Peregrinibacteria bacterium]
MANKIKRSDGEKEILKIIKKKNRIGLTITELVDLSKLSRSTVRVVLAKLEGKGDVSYRSIGMAKLYLLNGEGK